MSATQVPLLPRGGCRVLMLGTAVMAVAAAAVLALGTQDTRLLRLGLIAALWAALLGAFAAAQMRREARSCADHAEVLRTTYQFELEREVTARREHTLRVERELREQADRSQRSEIVELRTELAAMRANLERLTGAPVVERVMLRAESTRVFPLAAQPPRDHDNLSVAAAIPATRGPAVTSVTTPRNAPTIHPPPPPGQQRTVDDLLAAHGGLSTPRRRRSRANQG